MKGATRIRRVDVHNICVEVLTEVETKTKVDGKLQSTGETRLEWKEMGYYGGNLKWAAESALYCALPIGEVITPQAIDTAVTNIIDSTRDMVNKDGTA